MAMFGSSVALLLALFAMDELLNLKKRIALIESKQREDNLTKTLNGDE